MPESAALGHEMILASSLVGCSMWIQVLGGFLKSVRNWPWPFMARLELER